MKKILFTLAVFMVFCAVSQAQTIGFLRNAQSRITADMGPVKARWEKLLAENQHETTLTDFTIKSGLDKSTGKTYYILIATNRNKSIKIAELLKLKGNGDFIFMPKAESNIGTVTCSGCTNGCNPEILEGKWVCDPECPSAETPCQKSVTASIP